MPDGWSARPCEWGYVVLGRAPGKPWVDSTRFFRIIGDVEERIDLNPLAKHFPMALLQGKYSRFRFWPCPHFEETKRKHQMCRKLMGDVVLHLNIPYISWFALDHAGFDEAVRLLGEGPEKLLRYELPLSMDDSGDERLLLLSPEGIPESGCSFEFLELRGASTRNQLAGHLISLRADSQEHATVVIQRRAPNKKCFYFPKTVPLIFEVANKNHKARKIFDRVFGAGRVQGLAP